MNTRIYHEHGFHSRVEYLAWLAGEFDVPLSMVITLADSLGSSGDFCELVGRLEDYHCADYRYHMREVNHVFEE